MSVQSWEKFGGRYLVIGGPFEVVELEARVFGAYPVPQHGAGAPLDSEDYRYKQARLAATRGSGVLIDGHK